MQLEGRRADSPNGRISFILWSILKFRECDMLPAKMDEQIEMTVSSCNR